MSMQLFIQFAAICSRPFYETFMPPSLRIPGLDASILYKVRQVVFIYSVLQLGWTCQKFGSLGYGFC